MVLARGVAGRHRGGVEAFRVEHHEPVLAHQAAQPVGRRLRARAVGNRVQEGHGGLDLVRMGLLQGIDRLPAEVRGPEQPGVPHLVAVQQAHHRAGGEQLAGRVVHDRDEGRRRIAALAGMDRRQRAVRGGDGRQIAAHRSTRWPPQRPIGVQDPQGVRGVQGLADGAAQIGFQRVTVSAVLVAVGVQRGLDRVGARRSGSGTRRGAAPARAR